jgi:hypothetical protein
MLLSAVSVLVVAQSSSEFPEGLMNNPVLRRRSRAAHRSLFQFIFILRRTSINKRHAYSYKVHELESATDICDNDLVVVTSIKVLKLSHQRKVCYCLERCFYLELCSGAAKSLPRHSSRRDVMPRDPSTAIG